MYLDRQHLEEEVNSVINGGEIKTSGSGAAFATSRLPGEDHYTFSSQAAAERFVESVNSSARARDAATFVGDIYDFNAGLISTGDNVSCDQSNGAMVGYNPGTSDGGQAIDNPYVGGEETA